MPEHTETLIQLSNATIVSGRDGLTPLIEGVDWSLQAGDFWVIGGAHASGKSDFISTAAGLQRPSTGTVHLFGRDMSELSESERLDQRARIGVVFKSGGRMFPHLTVAENVALPLRYRFDWSSIQAAESVGSLLELTELTEHAQRAAGSLAASLQQRVGLARALALKPEVLLLDEPMAGLETRHRTWWLDLLIRLAQGVPYLGNQPTTIAIAVNDFSPWLQERRKFAIIKDRRWILPVGDSADIENLKFEI